MIFKYIFIAVVTLATRAPAAESLQSREPYKTSEAMGRSKRSFWFYDDTCKGAFDMGIFTELHEICDDCFNLYRPQHQIYVQCRENCYTSNTFPACLRDLHIRHRIPEFQRKVSIVAMKSLGENWNWKRGDPYFENFERALIRGDTTEARRIKNRQKQKLTSPKPIHTTKEEEEPIGDDGDEGNDDPLYTGNDFTDDNCEEDCIQDKEQEEHTTINTPFNDSDAVLRAPTKEFPRWRWCRNVSLDRPEGEEEMVRRSYEPIRNGSLIKQIKYEHVIHSIQETKSGIVKFETNYPTTEKYEHPFI